MVMLLGVLVRIWVDGRLVGVVDPRFVVAVDLEVHWCRHVLADALDL